MNRTRYVLRDRARINERAEARVEREAAANWDARYEYVTCSACGQRYQQIDYGCAQHHHSCNSLHIFSGKDRLK